MPNMTTPHSSPEIMDIRIGSNVGHIGPNWDKHGTFSDSDEKVPDLFPFGDFLTHFGSNPDIPGTIRMDVMEG